MTGPSYSGGGGPNIAWNRKGWRDAEQGKEPSPPEDKKLAKHYMTGYRTCKRQGGAK